QVHCYRIFNTFDGVDDDNIDHSYFPALIIQAHGVNSTNITTRFQLHISVAFIDTSVSAG
ncbi:MAG: hypothetical protein PVF06_00730, partial [Gammaproteobacteria bacterium]